MPMGKEGSYKLTVKDTPQDGWEQNEGANFRRGKGDESRGYGAARKPSGGGLKEAGRRKDTDNYVATE